MQTPKARTGSSEVVVPQKVSPRGTRQLRPSALYIDSVASTAHRTTSKDRSPKVIDRRSPRSPAPERKRPSRIPELESQISQLREDLKKVREQLSFSESCKKQAQLEAAESKQRLSALSQKLEESQQKLLKLSATEEGARVTEHQKEVTQEHERAESSELELLNLKQKLSESLCLVENLKNRLMDCKDSSEAQALVNETLRQLEAAKRTVEFLRTGAAKSVHGCNSTSLNQSTTRANLLEAQVSKLEAGLIIDQETKKLEKGEGLNQSEVEICCLKSEVERLRCALEIAETKFQEEQIRSAVQIRNANDLMEKIKTESSQRESKLEAELKRKKADIDDLKANLLDKETQLQCIVEENEKLKLKLKESLSHENELKSEIERSNECVAELKADMMDKETTLQSITEENEMLKIEINNRPSHEVAAEFEAAKAAEHEAVMKLMVVMEEADRSNRKAARMAEQLEAAQAANSEMEAELRRLKVQSDQWRKAAEAAAAVLSAGKGKISERSLSLDNSYNKPSMNKYLPYCEEIIDDDDDFQRKKNGNMLKKIGVLWKKPQK